MPKSKKKIVRTTVVLEETLEFNLKALSLKTKIEGNGKGMGELIEEAIKLLLKKHGFPTDKKVEIGWGKPETRRTE